MSGDGCSSACQPDACIKFTVVPPCPTPTPDTSFVRGRVQNADRLAAACQNYGVAPYIQVPSDPNLPDWWTKPMFLDAFKFVQADCTFEFKTWTGGIDYNATDIAAYLVPRSECATFCTDVAGGCPPCANNRCVLPKIAQAVAFEHISRNCPFQPVLAFCGYQLEVKQSSDLVGPGPNIFCGGPDDVWVNLEGLHLTISDRDGDNVWCSTEVILNRSLGHGTYCFQTKGLNLPDPWMVAGMFTFDFCAAAPHREIDFENSLWGDLSQTCNAQYVIQTSPTCDSCIGCGLVCSSHCQRFEVTNAEADLTHYLIWSPGQVTFRTFRGPHCRDTPSAADLLQEFTHADSHVPAPGEENFRFNFWLFRGHAPATGHSYVVTDFLFTAPTP